MHAVARLERIAGRSRRGSLRRKLSLGAVLPETGEEVIIHDLSWTGILIETTARLKSSEQLQVELPEVGAKVATVIWSSGNFFGCQFKETIPKRAISAALLKNPVELPVVQPAPTFAKSDDSETERAVSDRASLTVRLRVILGTSLVLWALILWALGLF